MPELALHPRTIEAIGRFIDLPSHAVVITGPRGMGKGSLATYLAESLLGLDTGKLVDYPYARRIVPLDGKAISIEPVRELEHFLSLKVPGAATIKRVIIIEDSHLMGAEAQNALLKTLEEPPADTVLILTAPSLQSLLPTIQSRLQTITVTKPTKTELQAILPADNFAQVYAISSGLPALASAMLTNTDHPLVAAVDTARQLLSLSSYERLLQVDTLAKNKQLSLDVLTILQQMAHVSLQTAIPPADRRWQHIMEASYAAAEALTASSNPKLVLTNLLLSL